MPILAVFQLYRGVIYVEVSHFIRIYITMIYGNMSGGKCNNIMIYINTTIDLLHITGAWVDK